MKILPPLETFGPRICIMGPSNSGKSTLAVAISRKINLPAIHLDQLYYRPESNWEPRQYEEFLGLHNDAINQEMWVIDGNYRTCAPDRFKRATGLILLDVSPPVSLLRYVRRCYSTKPRAGSLSDIKENVRWQMLKHLLLYTPGNRKNYKTLYDQCSLTKIFLPTPENIEECYKTWGLYPNNLINLHKNR